MTNTLSFPLGDETVLLNTTTWGNSKIVYINVHENEQTSVAAAKEVLGKNVGILIELKSKGERLISFSLNNTRYTFDPNRIFSAAGIRSTLLEYGPCDPQAESLVAQLAGAIIHTILSCGPAFIVALHNTTGDYSIDNYSFGGRLEQDKSQVFVNPLHARTELFFTTDSEAFEIIKAGGYNVVLQNNDSVTDDGSLSVYCADHELRYINIEALHGRMLEQMEMIAFIHSAL